MFTIEVEKETVRVKKGTSAKTGKAYEMREQTVVLHGLSRFPEETELTLPDDVEFYKVGHYEVTTPLVRGRYRLEAARDLGLVPVKTSKAA